MSSIDAAALAPVHRRVWQNNRPRRPPPMTSSTGNRSDGRGLCHGLDSAPAPRMSAPTQSYAPTCARAGHGRAGRAIFIIRTHGNSCCRVRVAHRGHKPSLFTAHERECRMLTALCPIDGARAPPLAPCSEGAARLPASIGSNSSATLTSIDRPLTMTVAPHQVVVPCRVCACTGGQSGDLASRWFMLGSGPSDKIILPLVVY